jgi:hypothetical protein
MLMKDWQYNGQMKKDKRTNNDLQNTTQKIEDIVTQIPPKNGDAEYSCSVCISLDIYGFCLCPPICIMMTSHECKTETVETDMIMMWFFQ